MLYSNTPLFVRSELLSSAIIKSITANPRALRFIAYIKANVEALKLAPSKRIESAPQNFLRR
jgi:hypothetical protein